MTASGTLTQPERRPASPARRGFSVTELLVVVGIIVLLIGLLLPALRNVRTRAKATTTQSTMNSFAQACDTFFQDHGRYPGLIPERILANVPNVISGTENALLELMGGAVRGDAQGYDELTPEYAPATGGWLEVELDSSTPVGVFKISLGPTSDDAPPLANRLGEGPTINGRKYQPYFAPGSRELAPTALRTGPDLGSDPVEFEIPDLLDAWGQPIIYVRRAGTGIGALVGQPGDNPPPQFYRGAMRTYLDATQLGDLGEDQLNRSLLNQGSDVEQDETFAQILRHPALGDPDNPLATGEARGGFILISAGPDGIFFSTEDGPGDAGSPVTLIVGEYPPTIVDEYDDIRVFGGG